MVGLHAHLGSGIFDIAHGKPVYADLAGLAERFPAVQALDIGGGLGVPHEPGEQPLALADLDAALAEVKSLYPRFELGRAGPLPGRRGRRAADSGHPGQAQERGRPVRRGRRRHAYPAASAPSLTAWHEIANLSRADQPATGRWQVVGPICESGDILGRDRALPEPQEGDLLLIANAGAYGASMASRYNLREEVREVYADEL